MGFEMYIPGSESTCKVVAEAGETCEGWDFKTGKPFPSCNNGLACKHLPWGVYHNPGAGKECRFAQKRETCEGWNYRTNQPFPSCDTGLACKPIDKRMMHIPGEDNYCAYAQEGEPCQGFDESTGKAFADCDCGLECKNTTEVSIFGRGKTCVQRK